LPISLNKACSIEFKNFYQIIAFLRDNTQQMLTQLHRFGYSGPQTTHEAVTAGKFKTIQIFMEYINDAKIKKHHSFAGNQFVRKRNF